MAPLEKTDQDHAVKLFVELMTSGGQLQLHYAQTLHNAILVYMELIFDLKRPSILQAMKPNLPAVKFAREQAEHLLSLIKVYEAKLEGKADLLN